MIIPWLRGFLSWKKAPLTWTLIALNIFIFVLTQQAENPSLNRLLNERSDLVLTGRLYDQYKNKDIERLISQTVKAQDEYLLLGAQALRDPQFLKAAANFKFYGDEVAIKDWQNSVASFQEKFHGRNSYLFGLISHESRPLTWITYQFMHAGIVHLVSNMVLLLIFAAALETMIGGIGVALVYIFGGMAGGLGFLLMSALSIAPMVGASGALSAVMACYAVFEKKRRVPFFFFLSPMKEYFGLIYLPTWLIFPLCFVADVASYISTPSVLGAGIAYSAHLGGAIFGILVGLALRSFKFTLPGLAPPN